MLRRGSDHEGGAKQMIDVVTQKKEKKRNSPEIYKFKQTSRNTSQNRNSNIKQLESPQI